jgi:hypothetical protein
MNDSVWPANTPDTLFEMCVEYCASNLETTVCSYDAFNNKYYLKPSVAFPASVNDELMKVIARSGIYRQHFGMLNEPGRVLWKRQNLEKISDLEDWELHQLLIHQPMELRIASDRLTRKSLQVINECGQNLFALHIAKSSLLFHDWFKSVEEQPLDNFANEHCQQLFKLPSLQCLTMLDIEMSAAWFPHLLYGLSSLTRLDLSGCSFSVSNLACGVDILHNLQILRLHNVPFHFEPLRKSFSVLVQFQSLRYA